MDLFLQKHLDWIKQEGDKALDWEKIIKGFGGKIAESGDGLVIGLFSKQINKWLSPQLPDEVKAELHEVFDSVIEKDYKEALMELADVAEWIIENTEINEKLKPWLLMVINIYEGVIEQLVD